VAGCWRTSQESAASIIIVTLAKVYIIYIIRLIKNRPDRMSGLEQTLIRFRRVLYFPLPVKKLVDFLVIHNL
jgi:hypothetical protein